MKSNKQSNSIKPVKGKRAKLTPEQRAAITKYLDEHPPTYTVHSVGEFIRPEVKAYWAEQRAKMEDSQNSAE